MSLRLLEIREVRTLYTSQWGELGSSFRAFLFLGLQSEEVGRQGIKPSQSRSRGRDKGSEKSSVSTKQT